MNDALEPHWQWKGEITIQQGILPSALRLEVLVKIHTGHQGIKKCRPGLSRQIEELVKERPTCIKTRRNHAEPMIPSRLPERPWQKLATNLFDWKGQDTVRLMYYESQRHRK